MPSANKIAEIRPQERRRAHRYPFTAAADVLDVKSNTRLSGRCSDLSQGGCFIDTISPFPIGTVVLIRLTMEQNSFQAQARVAYSMSGMGMGLAFTAAEADQIRTLKRWIAQLKGEIQPGESEHSSLDLAAVSGEDGDSAAAGNSEPAFVLNELIITLMRKKVLTETEGKLLLKKLVS